jgi:hypothetical protein
MLWFFLFLSSVHSFPLTRTAFLQTSLYSLDFFKSLNSHQHALIISCGDLGKSVSKRLKEEGFYVTAATTKPSRVPELRSVCDDVVVIPQIESKSDEELTKSILKSNFVVISDAIKIFSPHTYVRTALRVSKIIKKTHWPGRVCLISSENAYGCPKRGEILSEDSLIYSNMINRTQWRLNTNVMALQIRHAEKSLQSPNTIILRTAGIWDDKKFFETAMHTTKKEYSSLVGNSYMSFSTTNFIAETLMRTWKRKMSGTFNVANLPPCPRRKFLEVVHAMYGLENTIWVEGVVDIDTAFSIDKHPYLPSSQRSNSRLNCEKLQSLFKSTL